MVRLPLALHLYGMSLQNRESFVDDHPTLILAFYAINCLIHTVG